ncbi:MAG: tRNA pseudouridine(55) synthase TruB [Oscillospiraceae bacterium]|nr:tRNA pseudouridine(55) synthase TruB [Oscillospiraceae bacterium]
MSINGIIIIDKPADWTSHDVVAKLRGALKIKRVGHGGTLDPMATGVLPIFLGGATKASQFCENAEKEYIAGLRLGITTDTQDVTGNVLSRREPSTSSAELSDALQSFVGAQKQIPPMYSAIKVNGEKLYKLARRGTVVPRPARDIYISVIELLGVSGSDYSLRVVCSKGTYIRTLCHDIGAALGCGGAMSALRRTRAGAFIIDAAHTLDEILVDVAESAIAKYILPVDSLFSKYLVVTLSAAETRKFKNGVPYSCGNLPSNKYRFYGPDKEFLAICDVVNGSAVESRRFFDTL